MIGKEQALNMIEYALGKSPADQTEILMMGHDHFLTRYANSQIHQNTAEENSTFFIKAVLGKKIGISTINQATPKALETAVESACKAAKNQKEVNDYPGLPQKAPIVDFNAFCPRTAEINAEEKALIVQDMIVRTHGDRMALNGAFYTGSYEVAAGNTNGILAYHKGTLTDISALTSSNNTTGYASASARDVDTIDYTRLIEESLESAKAYDKTITLEPGKYPVVLEEYAVADMLIYLSYMGLSAESVENENSFLIPHRGEKLFSESISLFDDALNPLAFGTPFDYEGVPKSRLDFIKKGTITGNCSHNHYSAFKAGTKTTGHALPPDAGLSTAYPFHLIMEAGDAQNQDLLDAMGTGILIKRFHYLTSVHDLKTILSGMTRDGVFWVEKGKITARISDMRFTQSIIEALKNVEALSSKRKSIWFRDFSVDFPITAVVPRLFIKEFNFTGQTEF